MFNISWPELVLITIVAIILFGPNRLPDVARSFGKSVKAFKDGLRESMEEATPASPASPESRKEKTPVAS